MGHTIQTMITVCAFCHPKLKTSCSDLQEQDRYFAFIAAERCLLLISALLFPASFVLNWPSAAHTTKEKHGYEARSAERGVRKALHRWRDWTPVEDSRAPPWL